jgi:hypothetical protein
MHKESTRLEALLFSSAITILRQHAVATAALVCSLLALAGASYAATSLPANSVGARQIKNHSIDPVKFDPRIITGTVRAWARTTATGGVVGGDGPVNVSAKNVIVPDQPGVVTVRWNNVLPTNCATVATVATEGAGEQGGFADALTGPGVVPANEHNSYTIVTTFNVHGQVTALPFYVAVIC